VLSDTKQSVVSRKQSVVFFCSKTDFEFLIMSRKDSNQMYLNILKEIFKHEYEFKKELKI